jgi:hypothetical protein
MQTGILFSRFRRWSEAAMYKAFGIDYIDIALHIVTLARFMSNPAEANL